MHIYLGIGNAGTEIKISVELVSTHEANPLTAETKVMLLEAVSNLTITIDSGKNGGNAGQSVAMTSKLETGTVEAEYINFLFLFIIFFIFTIGINKNMLTAV